MHSFVQDCWIYKWKLGEDSFSRRRLSPCSPGRSRVSSPSRRSSLISVGGGQGQGYYEGRRSSGAKISSASVPVSPAATTSKYHKGCSVPNSVSSPSAFPQLTSLNTNPNYNPADGKNGGQLLRARSPSRSRSPFRGTNSLGGKTLVFDPAVL